MATVLRMKMARPSTNLLPIERALRPALQSGARYFNYTLSGPHGVNDINRRRHFQRRGRSQSTTLLSTPPAAWMDTDGPSSPSSSLSSGTKINIGKGRIRLRAEKAKKASEPIQMRVDVGSSNNLPKQSSHTTRILFQTIAPHVEFRTLRHLTKKLSRIVSRGHHKLDTQDRDGKEATLKRRLDMLFGTEGNGGGKGESSEVPNFSWGIKAHPWIQHTVYNYFMGNLLDKPYESPAGDDDMLSYKNDPTYPPNQNQWQREKHLETLIKAREVSLRLPIFWSEKSMRESGYSLSHDSRDHKRWEGKETREKKQGHKEKLAKRHSHKSGDQLEAEAEILWETLASRLPPRHFHKLMGKLEGFTRLDADSSMSPDWGDWRNGADNWCIDDDDGEGSNHPLPSLPESRAVHADWKKHRIPVLGKFLSDCSPSHSHLVAVDLGRYLYVELPEPAIPRKQIRTADELAIPRKESEEADVARDERRKAAHAIQKQRKLHSVEMRYKKTQSEFIQKIMDLQHQFAYWEKASDGGGMADAESDLDDSLSSHDEDAGYSDEDDDVSSDLMVGELQKIPLKKEQQEELAETMVELRRLGLRKEEDETKNKKSQGRPRKDAHLHFTAIRMEEKGEPPASDVTETADEAGLEQRLVFINNLPIDTTEEEIDQIYSRFGPLESIQLFNLRPDLDPGPLSKKQLQERRRKDKLRNRNLFASHRRLNRDRPRTPVYGMLRFGTAEGYRVATSPELCIFGCVIRRHPVMSIKHGDVTTLHLEQIPSNLYSMDLEYKLARLLRPRNVHVMLDGMKGVGTNGSGMGKSESGDYQEYSKPSSCQVKFEDFHTAFQAHQWIKDGEDGDKNIGTENKSTVLGSGECQLHWFRTPEDSMGYWTRELNF